MQAGKPASAHACKPAALLLATLSLPARSTNVSVEYFTPGALRPAACLVHSNCSWNSVCARDDCSFMRVAATERCASASRSCSTMRCMSVTCRRTIGSTATLPRFASSCNHGNSHSFEIAAAQDQKSCRSNGAPHHAVWDMQHLEKPNANDTGAMVTQTGCADQHAGWRGTGAAHPDMTAGAPHEQ